MNDQMRKEIIKLGFLVFFFLGVIMGMKEVKAATVRLNESDLGLEILIVAPSTRKGTQIKFNMTNLSTPGTTINSAMLCLYKHAAYGSWDNDVTWWRIDNQTWEESIGSDVLNQTKTNETTVSFNATSGWECIDVKDGIQEDIGNQNFTVRLEDPDAPLGNFDSVGSNSYHYIGEDNNNILFRSPNDPPEAIIEVSYTLPIPEITLKINETRGDKTLLDGNVNVTATLVTPSNGTVSIYRNDTLVATNASPLTVNYSSLPVGYHKFTGNWTGNEIYDPDSESWVATIMGLNITNIYNEETLVGLTANVTVSNVSSSDSATDITSYNNYSVYIPTGNVTVTVSSEGYVSRVYYFDSLTVGVFDAYLLSTAQGSYIRFHVKDSGGVPISGSLVTVDRLINNEYVTVERRQTDDVGVSRFFLNPTVTYRVTVEASGYPDKVISIVPSVEDYTITMGVGETEGYSSPFDYLVYEFVPSSNNLQLNLTLNHTINFTITEFNNSLVYYGLNLTDENGTAIFFENTTGATGGKISANVNTSLYTQIDVTGFFMVSGFNETEVTRTYYVVNVTRGDYTIAGWLEKVDSLGGRFAKQGLAIIMTAGVVFGIGRNNRAGGGIVGLAMLSGFAIYGWFDWRLLLMVGSGIIGLLWLRERM